MQPGPIGIVLIGPNILSREGLSRILVGAGFRILASATNANDPALSSLSQEKPILLIEDISDDFDTALRQIEFFKRRYPASRVAVLAHQHRLTEILSAFRLGVNAYLVNVANCDTFIKSLELVMLGVTLFPAEILTFISDRQLRRGRTDDYDGYAATGEDGYAATGEDDADHKDSTIDEHADEANGPADNDNVVGSGTDAHLPRGKSSGARRLSARQQSILRCLVQGDSNKTIARKIGISEATVKVHVKAVLRRIRVSNRTQAAIWAMTNGPFTSRKEEKTHASGELPADFSAGHKNGAKSLATLQVNGTSRVGLPCLHLVRKSIGRKDD
jgi:two-component system, NarL family, nitrate/nitrite response regulator NarL